MRPKTLLVFIIGVTALMIFIVVGSYFFNFSEFPISKDTQVWGSFGDYYGGILNPILSILNLGVLVYITFQISDIDNRRTEQELLVQRQIALFALKHDALKELNGILLQFQPELVKSDIDSEVKIILFRNEFNSFIDTYSHLFPFFEDLTWEELRETMLEISSVAGRRYKSGDSLDIDNEVRPTLEKFNMLKSEFINEVQQSILE